MEKIHAVFFHNLNYFEFSIYFVKSSKLEVVSAGEQPTRNKLDDE